MFMSKDAFDTSSSQRPHTAAYGRHSTGFSSSATSNQSRPHTGDIGHAGSLSSTENRQSMLERQRQLQQQRMRNRMPGSVMASARPVDGPAAPVSALSGQRSRAAPRFSAPRETLSVTSPTFGSTAAQEPVSRPQAVNGGPSMSDLIREKEIAKQTRVPADQVPQSARSASSSAFMPNPIATSADEDDTPHSPPAHSALPSKPAEQAMAQRGLSGSFDPTPKNSQEAARRMVPAQAQPVALDFSDMKAFLTNPTLRGAGIVQCYIERDKSSMSKRMYPVYSLYMKEGDRFLLAARKRSGQKTSNYIISNDADDLERDSSSFMGKLRSNFIGTEFVVYDNGANPKEMKKSSNKLRLRQEIAIVNYASNIMGSRGPRKMRVCVPRVNEANERAEFYPLTDEDSMLTKFQLGHTENMVSFINKPPQWNDQVGAYVLNFNGRVTMASVKNFQLVTPDDHDRVVLQFGRVGKDLFTMDYQWPLSPLQAFAIALSSFDYKLACE